MSSQERRAGDLLGIGLEQAGPDAATHRGWRRSLVRILPIAILFALPFVVYAQNLDDYFMSDDFDLVNSFYGEPPLYFLKLLVDNESGKVWSAMGIDSDLGHGYLRPLKIWLMKLDLMAWGTNPTGFHVTAVSLFGLNIVFVFLIFDLLSKGSRIFAFSAGAITAIHPVFSGIVPSITFREETLATFLGLWAIYQFMRFRLKGSSVTGFYILYMLALLSKESAIGILFFVVGFDLVHGNLRIYRREILNRAVVVYSPVLLVLMIYFALRFAAFGNFTGGDGDVNFEQYASLAGFFRFQLLFYDELFSKFLFAFAHPLFILRALPAVVAVAVVFVVVRSKRMDRDYFRNLFYLGPIWYLSWACLAYGIYFSHRHNIMPVIGLILFTVYLLWGVVRAFNWGRVGQMSAAVAAVAVSGFAFLGPTLEMSGRYDRASKTVADVLQQVDEATTHLPPGSKILLRNIPHWWGAPAHFGCGLLSALKMPFSETDLANKSFVYNALNVKFNEYKFEKPEHFDFEFTAVGDMREAPDAPALW